MADSNAVHNVVSDGRNEGDVQEENGQLVKDIMRYCNRLDYMKQKVLLIGQTGSGKSSVINTLLKVIIGEYIPRAKAGCGDFNSNYTLQLKRYPQCGARDSDFGERNQQVKDFTEGQREVSGGNVSTLWQSLRSVRHKLPDVFDSAGMKDVNDDKNKEILRLLIGGYIPPNTNIRELVRLQAEKGLGYLRGRFKRPKDDSKITMLIFTCSCLNPIPYNLIQCVQEVLQEVDSATASTKYNADIFVLMTKCDKVAKDIPMTHETEVKPEQKLGDNELGLTVTTEKFKEAQTNVTYAFKQLGTTKYNQLKWVSYNDEIGYDNVYIDNTSLKLLKILVTPTHTVNVPQNRQSIIPWVNNGDGAKIFFMIIVVSIFVVLIGVYKIKMQEDGQEKVQEHTNRYHRSFHDY